MRSLIKPLSALLSGALLLCATPAIAADAPVVAEGKQVSVEYTLSLKDEGVIESNVGGEPMVFVYGSRQILPSLENSLAGLAVGDTKKVEIAPADGYGPIYEDVIVDVAAEKLPEELRAVGAMVQTQGPNGRTIRGEVISVGEEMAKVDFNHPLAGETLFFDVKVLAIE